MMVLIACASAANTSMSKASASTNRQFQQPKSLMDMRYTISSECGPSRHHPLSRILRVSPGDVTALPVQEISKSTIMASNAIRIAPPAICE